MNDTFEKCGVPDASMKGGGMDNDWKGGWNGGKCGIGDKVTALGVTIGEILNNTDKALVFLDTEGNIQWLWSTTPEHLSWASMRIVELESKCSFFKQGRTEDLLSGKQDDNTERKKRSAFLRHELSAKRFIAQGLVILFEGGTKEEAAFAFDSADRFIVQRGRETSLIWLYRTFGILAAVSALALILLIKLSDQRDAFWSTLTCAAAGGIGAYISRALASREDLPCDPNAGERLHREEAVLRWSVGVVAGGILCLLVRGKALLGTLPVDNQGFSVVLAMAFLAGMSERFLPTLLNRFNDQMTAPPPPATAFPTKFSAANTADKIAAEKAAAEKAASEKAAAPKSGDT